MNDMLLDALRHIDPGPLDYNDWLRVGMALKAEGFPLSAWDDWSRTDSRRYTPECCGSKWAGFTGSGVGGGTIIHLAKEAGWIPPSGHAIGWDSVTSAPPAPVEQLREFLGTLFRPDDIVGYCVTSSWDSKRGKYTPIPGVYDLTAGEILTKLESGDIDKALGRYNHAAGAWIRLNPLDGHGQKKDNVVAFRYVLVESDEMTLQEQKEYLEKSKLPIATLVHSGGKSLHAAVHIDADSLEQYTERVRFLFDYLKQHGFAVDEANKDPCRLSRLPGAERGDKVQELLDTDMGLASWDEWYSYVYGISTDSWPVITPFDEVEAPAFPTECLPSPLDAFVEALAESTQTPEEMAGVLALVALSTAFQSRYEVEITPDWKEVLCLWAVAVAPPGERKSAVISALTKPIVEYEAQRREQERVEIAQNHAKKEMLEKELEAAKKPGKGNKGERQLDVMDLTAQLAEFQEMHEFRALADDTTQEKLVALMEQQGGCITVCSSEGGIFDMMRGRYDKQMNIEVYLKAAFGEPITVDRIGRRTNRVDSARLSMMLTIQPEVLAGLMANSAFRGRGLCGRFFYAMCKSRVGHRNINPEPIPAELRRRYRDFIFTIMDGSSKGVIKLSPEADRLRQDYEAANEGKLIGEFEFMRDWAGKIVGYVCRVAALLHCASHPLKPDEELIGPETMEAAIKIGHYLEANAQKAYFTMGADETVSDARYLLQKVQGEDGITKRELFRRCHGHFSKVEDMAPAVNELVDRGYIRIDKEETGGRPTEIIKINPMCQK